MTISNKKPYVRDFFWMVGILSFPFYIFGSGGAQISTLFLLVAGLSEIHKTNVKSENYVALKNTILPLFLFVLYSILITLTWFIIIKDSSILIFPIIYVFDFFILFSLCLRFTRDDKFVGFFAYTVLLSCLIQFFLSFIYESDDFRGKLFFNNPNQLGYYSLLTAAIITIFAKKKYLNTISYIIGMLCCIWLAQISLSKSAMVSGIFLLFYGFISNIKAQIIMIALIIAFLFFIGDSGILIDRFDIAYSRLDAIGSDSDDNAEGRGYDRIWLQPQMLLLGASEGAVYRWDTFLASSEMHSTWGTILFSYGIFGTVCWLIFLFRVGFSHRFVTFIPLLAVLAYGMTHNGLRFIYFWFFMAVLLFSSIEKQKKQL